MSTGLLFDFDDQVVRYLFQAHGWRAFRYDKALGILVDGQLRGAILFHCFNGFNVELSYYGQGTMTAGVIRCIARYILGTFDPARLTVMTSKRNKRYIRAFQKLGFRLEGIQRCHYGLRDCNRNTGVRFVMFRDRIEQIARFNTPLKQVS